MYNLLTAKNKRNMFSFLSLIYKYVYFDSYPLQLSKIESKRTETFNSKLMSLSKRA